MDLSFDVTTSFVPGDDRTKFRLESGFAHFDFRWNPGAVGFENQPADAYFRIRVTDPDGGLVFDEKRSGNFSWVFQQGGEENNQTAFYYEAHDFFTEGRKFRELLVFGALVYENEQGDDAVNIEFSDNMLWVYGWSPMVDYGPDLEGGIFRFGTEATNVRFEPAGFVPVPEPSTYGLAALVLLGAAAGWRRWRAARI
jgi:hypothetical protein